MDSGKNSLTTPQVEDTNSAAAKFSSAFQNMPSSSDGSSSNRQLQVEKDSPTSTSFLSTLPTNLKIQERVGNQTVLPIFDYGGPSDAIEGYVPYGHRRGRQSLILNMRGPTQVVSPAFLPCIRGC